MHAFHLHLAIRPTKRANVYVAAGAPARVYRITPEGKASIISSRKNSRCKPCKLALEA